MKLLLITSEYTGHGHKSISTALSEQFSLYPDVEVDVQDGFRFVGEAGVRMSKFYGPMTRRAKEMWRIVYAFSDKSASAMAEILAVGMKDRLSAYLEKNRPDMIVTVHSMFNGSVINALESLGWNIPVVVVQADLINIHSTWCDPRAYRTICMTPEAQSATLCQGVPPSRVVVGSFPIRQIFSQAAMNRPHPPYTGQGSFHCLIASGGEGSGNLRKYAEKLLSRFDCRVTVLCGRNQRLKKSLEEDLWEYSHRLTALGFVSNMQDYIADADLMIARGSPNTLMEAVVCGTPLIITGALPGQEAENPALFARHGLGVCCESTSDLTAVVRDLMADNARKLADIRAAQQAYRNLNSARDDADYIVRLCREYLQNKKR